eukprot:SAG11_NODE_412_length_9695_cov_5.948729_2_plen_146_part_00
MPHEERLQEPSYHKTARNVYEELGAEGLDDGQASSATAKTVYDEEIAADSQNIMSDKVALGESSYQTESVTHDFVESDNKGGLRGDPQLEHRWCSRSRKTVGDELMFQISDQRFAPHAMFQHMQGFSSQMLHNARLAKLDASVEY